MFQDVPECSMFLVLSTACSMGTRNLRQGFCLQSGNPEISPGGVENEKKSKIPKLYQDIGLDEVFLEKNTSSSIRFLF